MPEISLLGWMHTIIAIIALVAGYYTLAVHKIISLDHKTGRIYLLCTLIAAVSALMIYQHGKFGGAHALAVLTLLALLAGYLVKKVPALEKIADYFQALCYSGTLLFHMLPAITDSLLRLPVNEPILSNPQDPLLKSFYLAFLGVFVVAYVLQFIWLKNRK